METRRVQIFSKCTVVSTDTVLTLYRCRVAARTDAAAVKVTTNSKAATIWNKYLLKVYKGAGINLKIHIC